MNKERVSREGWEGLKNQRPLAVLPSSGEPPHLQLHDSEVVGFREAAVVEGVAGAAPAQVQVLIHPQTKVATAREKDNLSESTSWDKHYMHWQMWVFLFKGPHLLWGWWLKNYFDSCSKSNWLNYYKLDLASNLNNKKTSLPASTNGKGVQVSLNKKGVLTSPSEALQYKQKNPPNLK